MSQFFTPTMIIENTQLGKVVSLLKGFRAKLYHGRRKIDFELQRLMLITFSCVKAKGSEYLKFKIDFSSFVLEFRSNHFRIETTLPSCVFSIIIVGVKNWFILKKSIFLIFYRFQTLLQKAQNGSIAVDDFVADAEKISKTWLYDLQTFDLVEEYSVSKLSVDIFWTSSGCLLLQKMDFCKKNRQKKGKYRNTSPLFSRLRDINYYSK